MITFSSKILQFAKNADKTGWSYIIISKKQADELHADCRKGFRVKGLLDNHKIQKASILPMGDGSFILPINAAMRKGTGKSAGDSLKVKLEYDNSPLKLSADLVACLKDEPGAYDFFKTLTRSHQMYFSNWIEGAKTSTTKTRRITMAVMALASGHGFSEMLQANKQLK